MVVARKNPGATAEMVAAHFPVSQVQLLASKPLDERARRRVPPGVVTDVCTSLDEMLLRIVGHPAPQLLIDAIPGAGAGKVKRFRELSFALADGGAYLAIDAANADRGEDSLASELARLMSLQGWEDAGTSDEWFDERLRKNIASVSSEGPAVLVGKFGRHYLNLREEVTTPVLMRRYGTSWGRELMVRPAETFRSKIEVTANVEDPEQRFPNELHVPPLYLREYVDVVCAPRQVVVTGSLVLSASFHHPSVPRPRNRMLPSASKRFAETDIGPDDAQPLPGTYFHLDSEYPGLFGHMYTEDIARLWGWELAKRLYPQLRILRSAEDPENGPAPYELETLRAYGIAEHDIVCIDRPVRAERLVTASQEFHNGAVIYVSEHLSETWSRLRDGLRTSSGPRYDKIFIARPDVKRSCLNSEQVEAAFASHGFEVLRPELLPLPEQAELFATARVIAGYAGSGMFGMIHCEQPGTRIVISSDMYSARDVFLISALKGDDFHYIACPTRVPDASRLDAAPKGVDPTRPHSQTTLLYDFEFDFDRDGDALEKLLAST